MYEMFSVVNQHCLDADPDSTFHFDADQDPDPIPNFSLVVKSATVKNFLPSLACG
jgi:hypothetical protein